ncbi:unnamed protein product [Ostreobium quekettii]|uniref:Uncharacterized protein n=1 Tax=Ostreobium quekettii TaxID=121088 RepID=A0A8S1J212_9CHLO|nr:unnamed protein product [Ostreobium quekettii]
MYVHQFHFGEINKTFCNKCGGQVMPIDTSGLKWQVFIYLLCSWDGKSGLLDDKSQQHMQHGGDTLLSAPICLSACRFHPMNPNLLFVGNGGAISVMNLSTGSQAFSHTIAHGGSHPEVTALACSNTSMFAGDENGDLHVFRCEVHVAGSSQHLPAIFAWPHPGGKGSAIVSIQWQGYITAVKGPALLVMYLDSTVAVYKVYDGVSCRLELFTKAELPPAARRICAVWCPSISIHEPQCIAAGGEDTNVHVYDIHRVRSTAVVVNQLQAHAAPVVDVSWSYDESCLASGDCDGTVIVWKRDHSAMSSRRTSAD